MIGEIDFFLMRSMLGIYHDIVYRKSQVVAVTENSRTAFHEVNDFHEGVLMPVEIPDIAFLSEAFA